jgi:DNA-binding NtrC family response regulator
MGLKQEQWQEVSALSSHTVPMIGQSFAMRQIERQLRRLAPTPLTVIVHGETGAGKELVARALHAWSDRADHPFIAVDCGALSEHLLESELFGHRKGAFTGAETRRAGYFEQAHQGTLFLDEIANLSLHAQMKLLRAIQERRVFPLGSEQDLPINVRLVVATNVELAEEVAAGRFRSDLFYRLNEFKIFLPPLRDRREDILLLAQQFLHEANRELGKGVKGFAKEAHVHLLTYDWPGNVRELRNAVRRAVLLSTDVIEKQHLCQPSTAQGRSLAIAPSRPVALGRPGASLSAMITEATRDLEKAVIQRTLHETKGNKSEAARRLKIGYKTLQRKVHTYGLRRSPAMPVGQEPE